MLFAPRSGIKKLTAQSLAYRSRAVEMPKDIKRPGVETGGSRIAARCIWHKIALRPHIRETVGYSWYRVLRRRIDLVNRAPARHYAIVAAVELLHAHCVECIEYSALGDGKRLPVPLEPSAGRYNAAVRPDHPHDGITLGVAGGGY